MDAVPIRDTFSFDRLKREAGAKTLFCPQCGEAVYFKSAVLFPFARGEQGAGIEIKVCHRACAIDLERPQPKCLHFITSRGFDDCPELEEYALLRGPRVPVLGILEANFRRDHLAAQGTLPVCPLCQEDHRPNAEVNLPHYWLLEPFVEWLIQKYGFERVVTVNYHYLEDRT